MGLLGVVTGPFGPISRYAENLLEVARYGGLLTGEEPADFEVVDRGVHYRLRHYRLGLPADAPAIVLVPPLMVSTEVFDVSPRASAVRTLAAQGVQSYVVDFGSPEHEPGGLDRTIEDHIIAVSHAVDFVKGDTGRDVHLAGYSQGGMFCYQTAAYRRSKDVGSVTVFGSPVDMKDSVPFRIPRPVAVAGARVAGPVLSGRSIPGWATRIGFAGLDPVGAIAGRLGFLMQLHDRESLLPREGQRRFLMRDGWVAFPGPSLEYLLDQFVLNNRMLAGGFTVQDKAVSLSDVSVPVLTVVGEVDGIAPPATVRSIRRAAPRADVYELTLRTGHFGLVVGSAAMATSWPAAAAWVKWREGEGELPEGIVSVPRSEGPAARERLEHNLELAGSLTRATRRRLAREASHPVARLKRLAAPAAQAPRIGQVIGMRPNSQLSLAQVIDRAATRSGKSVGFLWEGFVYEYAEINDRVDQVVRGLIRDGVKPGDRVGVLMDTRPTALAVVAALNRLGAVAVLLRPDSDTEREAALGEITLVIADPANAHAAPSFVPTWTFLLRFGDDSREGMHELELTAEEADPDPDWYVRNGGRADDLAFVFFNGNGSTTRTVRVTNGRWALAAYGTASSAQLSGTDTVFTVSPLHHPAGLLTAVGGAIVGGSRIAMLSDFEPTTFWAEARRYGVTAVAYTWSQLNALVEAPPDPSERDHRIRLFYGSGMPRGLWRRLTERFGPAGVLEMWGSGEKGAILANVSGAKIGSVGRPLPGAATLKLGRFDLETGEIVRSEAGYVVEAAAGELGLLWTTDRVAASSSASEQNVFRAGDSWQKTGSLFRRDADGDYWLEGIVDDIIRTKAGPALPAPVGAVFEELPNVTSAVAYALPGRGGSQVLVVAVSVRQEIGPAALTAAAWRLPEASRPAIVHVVPEMPLSSAGRPAGTAVRDDGIDLAHPAWRYDSGKGEYQKLSKTTLAKLVGPAKG